MTRLRVKQNETGESQSGLAGGGWTVFWPFQAVLVADRLPALRWHLRAHPARLPHWAGIQEEASAVGNPQEKSQDDPITSCTVSTSVGRKKNTCISLTTPSPESKLHARVRTRIHTCRLPSRACPLLTQTNKAETDLAPGKCDGAWKLRQNKADGWPLKGLGLSEGQ